MRQNRKYLEEYYVQSQKRYEFVSIPFDRCSDFILVLFHTHTLWDVQNIYM